MMNGDDKDSNPLVDPKEECPRQLPYHRADKKKAFAQKSRSDAEHNDFAAASLVLNSSTLTPASPS